MKSNIDVVAAIIRKDTEIFLARRNPEQHLAGHWELPGGKVEPGENSKESLTRELNEELGIQAIIGGFYRRHAHDYPEFSITLTAFFVESYEGMIQPIEHDRSMWIIPSQCDRHLIAPADVPILKHLAHTGLWPEN